MMEAKKKYFVRWILGMLLLCLGACSLADGPENPEPVLEVTTADGIGRTEATLHVSTDSRGASAFSSIRFVYSEENEEAWTVTEEVELKNKKGSLTITGLKPGTSYTYRAEGHTDAATILSGIGSFSTLPLDPPVIEDAGFITRGPTGFVLSFTLTDEGGAPVTEAGCEMTDLSSGEVSHIPVREELSGPGEYTVLVNHLLPGRKYSVVPFAANTAGCCWGGVLEFVTSDSFVVSEPGQLKTLLDEADLPEKRLVVAGPLNGDDFRALRQVFISPGGRESLTELDITGVSICAGGGNYDGQHHTEEDVITSGLFASLDRLVAVGLPLNAKAIRRDAFSGTPVVRLAIPPGAKEVDPSFGCTALTEITVEAGNRSYHAVDGVLYDFDMTRIVWFPQGKTGEYVIPASITSIGENAFRGTSITSLVIPDGVVTISRGAFSGSKLASITLPPSLTTVPEGIFQDCTSLKELHLGAAIDFIGAYAFDGAALTMLSIEAEYPPVVSEETFVSNTTDLFNGCTLLVPAGSRALYRNHKHWSKFRTIKSL